MKMTFKGLPSDVAAKEIPHPTKEEWLAIVWKKAERVVFQLQKRIYKAVKAGQVGNAKRLCKLLIRSQSAATFMLGKLHRITRARKRRVLIESLVLILKKEQPL